MEEQFHLLSLNRCWHNRFVLLAAALTVSIKSRLSLQKLSGRGGARVGESRGRSRRRGRRRRRRRLGWVANIS